MARRRQLFRAIDKDNSGELNHGEIMSAVQEIWPQLDTKEVTRAFETADEDGSGLLSELEFKMMIGFVVMLITGFLLYYAIPVRTTQSLWFRVKVVLLIAAGINAFLFRAKMQASSDSWDLDPIPPKRIRIGAAVSLTLWAGVVITGRTIAYDWFDCHKQLPYFMYWAAGCVDEMAALQ